MIAAAPHPREEQRLRALDRYQIVDTLPEQAYDDLTLLASQICGTPIALISLVDEHRQWFKSKVGIDATETPREIAFCAHAILEPENLLIVPDATRDERFATNPLVEERPNIRFYAGAPLVTSDGMPLGTLCVIDRVPRDLEDAQRKALHALARQVISQLELRLNLRRLQQQTKQLEKSQIELERSNQELDDFAYIASHDLKEPLRGIATYSGFLIEDYAAKFDDEGRRKLETLKSLAQRMNHLIESLLYFSRVGRTELACGPTSLKNVVEEVVRSLAISIEERGVEIEVAEDLPTVFCDRARIAEVFRNLISNALKYNDKPEKFIRIGFDRRPDAASDGEGSFVFRVSDNGIGIREKHMDRIFKIFKRLHARDQFGGGSGAGLTIVKKIVERHGGRIWVESTYGEGTTFHFTLGEGVDEA